MTPESARTLDGYLIALEPHVPPGLLPAAAWQRLRVVGRSLPPAGVAGFERRLGGGEQVDLSLRFGRRDGRIEALLGRNEWVGIPAAALESHVWSRLIDFCRDWTANLPGFEAIDHLWLEWDLAPGPNPAPVPHPNPFFGRSSSSASGEPAVSGATLSAFLDRPASRLLGSAFPPGLTQTVLAAIRQLPPGTGVRSVGLWMARDLPGLRLTVAAPGAAAVEACLRAIGWAGCRETAGEAAAVAGAGGGVILHLDFAPDLLSRVGISTPFTHRNTLPDPAAAPDAVLERLVRRGWCSEEERAALLEWPGHAVLPAESDPWYDARLRAAEVLGRRPVSVLLRGLSHVKLTAAEHGEIAAKAYFGYHQRYVTP